MVLSIVERVKGFLVSPSKTFDASKEDTVGDAFKYFAAILVIYAVIIAVISIVGLSAFAAIEGIFGAPFKDVLAPLLGAAVAPLFAIGFFIVAFVAGVIGVFIGGLWFHIWVYLVGGRKGVGQTIEAVMYGMTPNLILGWIPFVNIIAAIWAIIVVIIGVRQLHELSTGKAVLAWILAVIIPAIITGLIVVAFIAMMPPTGRHPFGGY